MDFFCDAGAGAFKSTRDERGEGDSRSVLALCCSRVDCVWLLLLDWFFWGWLTVVLANVAFCFVSLHEKDQFTAEDIARLREELDHAMASFGSTGSCFNCGSLC